MNHLITMQPGFKPPLCAEIDRLSMLAKVRRQIMDILYEDPTAHVPEELTDEEERLSGEGNNGPR